MTFIVTCHKELSEKKHTHTPIIMSPLNVKCIEGEVCIYVCMYIYVCVSVCVCVCACTSDATI